MAIILGLATFPNGNTADGGKGGGTETVKTSNLEQTKIACVYFCKLEY